MKIRSGASNDPVFLAAQKVAGKSQPGTKAEAVGRESIGKTKTTTAASEHSATSALDEIATTIEDFNQTKSAKVESKLAFKIWKIQGRLPSRIVALLPKFVMRAAHIQIVEIPNGFPLKKLPASLVKFVSKELIPQLDINKLSPQQFAQMTGEQLDQLSNDQMRHLTSDQLHAKNAKGMSGRFLARLSENQLGTLNPKVLDAFDGGILFALNKDQLSALLALRGTATEQAQYWKELLPDKYIKYLSGAEDVQKHLSTIQTKDTSGAAAELLNKVHKLNAEKNFASLKEGFSGRSRPKEYSMEQNKGEHPIGKAILAEVDRFSFPKDQKQHLLALFQNRIDHSLKSQLDEKLLVRDVGGNIVDSAASYTIKKPRVLIGLDVEHNVTIEYEAYVEIERPERGFAKMHVTIRIHENDLAKGRIEHAEIDEYLTPIERSLTELKESESLRAHFLQMDSVSINQMLATSDKSTVAHLSRLIGLGRFEELIRSLPYPEYLIATQPNGILDFLIDREERGVESERKRWQGMLLYISAQKQSQEAIGYQGDNRDYQSMITTGAGTQASEIFHWNSKEGMPVSHKPFEYFYKDMIRSTYVIEGKTYECNEQSDPVEFRKKLLMDLYEFAGSSKKLITIEKILHQGLVKNITEKVMKEAALQGSHGTAYLMVPASNNATTTYTCRIIADGIFEFSGTLRLYLFNPVQGSEPIGYRDCGITLLVLADQLEAGNIEQARIREWASPLHILTEANL